MKTACRIHLFSDLTAQFFGSLKRQEMCQLQRLNEMIKSELQGGECLHDGLI